tara:strand:- start:20042 stop:20746 length:705 start_codon:yes stop_codon:yes gene_type:complete
MNRFILLQRLIDKYNFKTYLEIGTFHGRSFFPLKCKSKIAVDPDFRFSDKDKREWKLKNLCNFRNRYFEKTSDNFFKEDKDFLNNFGKIDLIFIDGLHTFRASLNDALNSLKYISVCGFIVMHDCYPPHKAAATPASSLDDAEEMNLDGWTGEWCGDVWKTIVYLKEKYGNSLKVNTLNADYGLGIIQMENSNFDLEIDQELFDRITQMKYEEVTDKFNELLNLKEVNELELIL